MDKIRNERIKELMEVREDMTGNKVNKKLSCYGHIKRMTPTRLPNKIGLLGATGEKKERKTMTYVCE